MSGFEYIIYGIILANRAALVSPLPEPTPIATPAPEKPTTVTTRGLASYYSRAGCLGCNPDFITASGDILDDTKLTVAYNRAPLNTYVTITNTKNDKTVTAKVNDRGGFERHGKIIDLSVATKNTLGCGDVCRVEIKTIK